MGIFKLYNLVLYCLVLVSLLAVFSNPSIAKIDCDDLLAPDPKELREEIRQSNVIIKSYVKLAKQFRRTPTFIELETELKLLDTEINLKESIGDGRLFTSYQELKQRARAKNPNNFRYVVDTEVFDQERTEKLVEAIKNRKRLILTTAVAGAPVNRVFLDSLLNYAKKMDAEIIIYPANMITDGLDPVLLETSGVHILTNSIEVAPWLNLNRIKLVAKQINPLMGLDRIGKRGQSQIVGSPKMHVLTVPTIDNLLRPHRLISTGAITDPLYNGDLYIQGRTDEIAAHDHVMGALILEKSEGRGSDLGLGQSLGNFHMRHIEFMADSGGFNDLDSLYTPSLVKKIQPKALVLGDIHVGDTDQKLFASLKEQILSMRPEYIVLHDVLNGHSISHHEKDKLISLAKKAEKGLMNLEQELANVSRFINSLLAIDPNIKVVVAPSNHDFWLNRWLQEGQFMKEPQNTALGIELAKVYVEGKDPLQHALISRTVEQPKIEYPKRVIFVDLDNSFKVGSEESLVEIGKHGHLGSNGAKGSIRSMQRGMDRAVFGHTHTYARYNGVVNVGTFTNLLLSYNRGGLSNWVQSLALVGENGSIQVLEYQDGKWFSEKKSLPKSRDGSDLFFKAGYPRVISNPNSPSGVGQVDQYNRGAQRR